MAWTSGPEIGPAGSSGILASADYAFAKLAGWGIPIPGGSRFQLARAAVDAAHNRRGRFPPPDILAEATRSIFELYWVSRALRGGAGPLGEPVHSTLVEILSGPQLPRNETDRNSRPRNLQFELFTGAWLTSGGIRARMAEPDLNVLLLNREVGVAAKRVRSSAQLRRRVRDAKGQIARSGMPGLIAINVDPLIDHLSLENADQPELARRFEEAVPELQAAIEESSRNPAIVGLLALGMHVYWQDAAPTPRVVMSSFVNWKFFPEDAAEEAAYNELFVSFRKTQSARMKAL